MLYVIYSHCLFSMGDAGQAAVLTVSMKQAYPVCEREEGRDPFGIVPGRPFSCAMCVFCRTQTRQWTNFVSTISCFWYT